MNVGYTEFSYGYAFTENLLRHTRSLAGAAPYFPSLNEEGGLGYDVKLHRPGAPLFFQFKLPELITRRDAKEIATYKIPGVRVRFLRIALMRRSKSRQHELLIDWEARYPDSVFYAAPLHKYDFDFNRSYSVAQVHLDSFLLSPKEIGRLPDDKQHTIAYDQNPDYAWLCSDPRELKISKMGSLLERARARLSSEAAPTLALESERLESDVLDLVPRELSRQADDLRRRIQQRARISAADLPEERRQVVERLMVVRELLRVGAGLEMQIAQERSAS